MDQLIDILAQAVAEQLLRDAQVKRVLVARETAQTRRVVPMHARRPEGSTRFFSSQGLAVRKFWRHFPYRIRTTKLT